MDIAHAMEIFVTVVDEGGFSAAADHLNSSNGAISRHVAALEEELGARLLNRTTRKISLTEAGRDFYERAKQILEDIEDAKSTIDQQRSAPKGILKISAPLAYGISEISRLLPEFRKQYPEISLDIQLTDKVVDLVHDGIDVAIRISSAPSENLVARKLGPVSVVICASPRYLKKYGAPKKVSDLSDHSVLSFSYFSEGESWTLKNNKQVKETARIHPMVRANNGYLLLELALNDDGIVALPFFMIRDALASGKLVEVLPDWHLKERSIYAVYQSRKLLAPKVRVFIDFLVKNTER